MTTANLLPRVIDPIIMAGVGVFMILVGYGLWPGAGKNAGHFQRLRENYGQLFRIGGIILTIIAIVLVIMEFTDK